MDTICLFIQQDFNFEEVKDSEVILNTSLWFAEKLGSGIKINGEIIELML